MEDIGRNAHALLSARGRDRMLKLQRQLQTTSRALDQAFSRFIAAVSACDRTTQEQFMSEYIHEMIRHRDALRQLVGFINSRFCAEVDEEVETTPPTDTQLSIG